MPDFLTDDYYARLRLFLDATGAETERGRALVAASLIEQMLEEILKAHLLSGPATERLFSGPNAPLGSLSSKAAMARSLALVSEAEYRDVELVRKIRNQFAHHVQCSFGDQNIVAWSSALQTGMAYIDQKPLSDKAHRFDPSGRFSMATTALVTTLYNRATHVARTPITERSFDR